MQHHQAYYPLFLHANYWQGLNYCKFYAGVSLPNIGRMNDDINPYAYYPKDT